MSNSHAIIAKCFRLRITATLFPNTLNNVELNELYFSLNIIRVSKSRTKRLSGYIARMEEGRVAYRVLVRKTDGKRLLWKTQCRWENNIKMDLQEV